jgi:hypothetical protein
MNAAVSGFSSCVSLSCCGAADVRISTAPAQSVMKASM